MNKTINVWMATIKRADGSTFEMRLTGYTFRKDAMAAATWRKSNLKGSKIISLRNVGTEEA